MTQTARHAPTERVLRRLGYSTPRVHRGPGWAALATPLDAPTPSRLVALLRDTAALAGAPDADPRTVLLDHAEGVVLRTPPVGAWLVAWATADSHAPPRVVRATLTAAGTVCARLRVHVPHVTDVPFSVESAPRPRWTLCAN